MMEAVEDIPADTIMDGLSWGWETYGDYLRELGRRPLGVNVGGLIGHCVLRYYVMGARSLDRRRPPTPTSTQMAEIVGEAIDAGTLGFSTSRASCTPSPTAAPCPARRPPGRAVGRSPARSAPAGAPSRSPPGG